MRLQSWLQVVPGGLGRTGMLSFATLVVSDANAGAMQGRPLRRTSRARERGRGVSVLSEWDAIVAKLRALPRKFS